MESAATSTQFAESAESAGLRHQYRSERYERPRGVFVMSRSSVRVRQAAPPEPQVSAMIWGFFMFATSEPGMDPGMTAVVVPMF